MINEDADSLSIPPSSHAKMIIDDGDVDYDLLPSSHFLQDIKHVSSSSQTRYDDDDGDVYDDGLLPLSQTKITNVKPIPPSSQARMFNEDDDDDNDDHSQGIITDIKSIPPSPQSRNFDDDDDDDDISLPLWQSTNLISTSTPHKMILPGKQVSSSLTSEILDDAYDDDDFISEEMFDDSLDSDSNSNSDSSDVVPITESDALKTVNKNQNEKIYFKDAPLAYFRGIQKTKVGKSGQIKKSDRVFSNKHSCLYCGNLVCKPIVHIERKHSGEKEVADLNLKPKKTDSSRERKEKSSVRKKQLEILRNRGNHKHNMAVKLSGVGEIILLRRPSGKGIFYLSKFGPCPNCYGWISNQSKHGYRCVAKDKDMIGKNRGTANNNSQMTMSEGIATTELTKEVLETTAVKHHTTEDKDMEEKNSTTAKSSSHKTMSEGTSTAELTKEVFEITAIKNLVLEKKLSEGTTIAEHTKDKEVEEKNGITVKSNSHMAMSERASTTTLTKEVPVIQTTAVKDCTMNETLVLDAVTDCTTSETRVLDAVTDCTISKTLVWDAVKDHIQSESLVLDASELEGLNSVLETATVEDPTKDGTSGTLILDGDGSLEKRKSTIMHSPPDAKRKKEINEGVKRSCNMIVNDDDDDDDDDGVLMTDALSQTQVTPSTSNNSKRKENLKKRLNKMEGKKCNRKNNCLFCGKQQAKFVRHLTSMHSKEIQVQKLLSFPKGSSERFEEARKLKHLGNYQHNVKVLEDGKGELLVARRSKRGEQVSNVSDFVPCVHCKGFFVASELWRHSKVCVSKDDSLDQKGGVLRVGRTLVAVCENSDWDDDLFSDMKDDEIGMIAKQDKIIRCLGVELYRKNGKESLTYVRVKIREIAQMVKALRQNNSNETMCMADILKPSMFDQVIEAVHELSTGLHKTPLLVSRIGYLLKRCGQIYLGIAIRDQDKSAEKDVTDFLRLYNKEYSLRLSSICLETIATEKQNKMDILPITQDIVKLQKYLHEMMYLIVQTFNQKNDFKDLATITLSYLVMFNTTRSEDVSRMLISDFLNRPATTGANCDLLSPTEKRLSERLCLVHIHRKRRRSFPVLVPPDAIDAILLLVDANNRKHAEINPDNNFVFLMSENSTDNIIGQDALSSTVDTADLTAPETIRSTSLRRFTATVAQILIMNENEMAWLGAYLGCDMCVQEKFDRLRQDDVELAKLAKLLYAVDTGKIHKFTGKNLDEIDIDGDIQDLIGETEDKTDDDDDDDDENEDDDVNKTSNMEAGVTNKTAKRRPVKRNGKLCFHMKWGDEEKEFVSDYFHSNIANMNISGVGKARCEDALKKGGSLFKNRTWIQVKSCVKNIINKNKTKIKIQSGSSSL